MTTLDLTTIRLDAGKHDTPSDGLCLLEAVAFAAGRPHTDCPPCVSPVLGAYGRALNDALPDGPRQQLVPLIPRLIGTAGDGQDEARAYLALDWLIRTHTPAWLDLAGLREHAQALRDLRRIVDLVAAQSAEPVVREARRSAAAAGAAAWDAAGAAAWDAAGAAARAAAGDAAWDAAWAAARAAAWDAARAAARAAAWDAAGAAAWDAAWAAAGAAAWDAARAAAGAAAGAALQPTIDRLQASAVALFAQMINPAETPS